jgi:hypothetical protein
LGSPEGKTMREIVQNAGHQVIALMLDRAAGGDDDGS